MSYRSYSNSSTILVLDTVDTVGLYTDTVVVLAVVVLVLSKKQGVRWEQGWSSPKPTHR